MSYSSETESDEEVLTTKTEYVSVKAELVHTDVNTPIFSAIVVEESDLTGFNEKEEENYEQRYFTRSRRNTREPLVQEVTKESLSEEEFFYEDDYEKEEQTLSQEDYTDEDVPFIAQQVKTNGKEKKNRTNNLNLKRDTVKRARKSALPWTAAESKTLSLLVSLYGAKEWQFVAKILQSKHNNNRTAAQCSQRWCRVINPSINKGVWESKEDKLLCDKYEDLQGSWCKIVKFFPDRTDTQCKRRYEKILQLRKKGTFTF